jgi:hypothetical protein
VAKLPSFQFYPGDWQKEPTLRRCSKAAKGVFVDMLCLMFECEERGVLSSAGKPWADPEIAAAIGGDISENLSCITELVDKGVVSRSPTGAIYCRRMVREESKRRQGAERASRYRNARSNAPITLKSRPYTEDEVENEDEKIERGRGRVREYATSLGAGERDADWFFFKGESSGWTNGGRPIFDWKATFRTWWLRGFFPSQEKSKPSSNGSKNGQRELTTWEINEKIKAIDEQLGKNQWHKDRPGVEAERARLFARKKELKAMLTT